MALAEGNNIFLKKLAGFIGTTVTIYTTSGGESGVGITGVLECVDSCSVKLITCIGPAPCCPLGSACTGGRLDVGGGGGGFGYADMAGGFIGGKRGYIDMCGCYGFGRCTGGITNVGSVTVIPIDRIAAYVHNTV